MVRCLPIYNICIVANTLHNTHWHNEFGSVCPGVLAMSSLLHNHHLRTERPATARLPPTHGHHRRLIDLAVTVAAAAAFANYISHRYRAPHPRAWMSVNYGCYSAEMYMYIYAAQLEWFFCEFAGGQLR